MVRWDTISTSNKPSPDAGKYRNSVLTLKAEQNPFKANTENEAFDIVDEVVHDTHTQEVIELLKEPYQVERLGGEAWKRTPPLEAGSVCLHSRLLARGTFSSNRCKLLSSFASTI